MSLDLQNLPFKPYKYDRSRAKGTLKYFFVPEDFLPAFGLIGVGWSSFDAEFNDFLGAMFQVNGTTPPPGHWRRAEFRKRVATFRDEMAVAFGAHPGVLKELDRVLCMASELHWKRNVLLHGRLGVTVTPLGKPIMVAEGKHNGREVKLELDHDALLDIAHGFPMITGGLAALTMAQAAHTLQQLSSQEKSALRTFGLTTGLTLPSREELEAQHGPFPD
jgi:hypothetical protein